MINFDAVDFSEHRSEEVMFLLTLSVHFCLPNLDEKETVTGTGKVKQKNKTKKQLRNFKYKTKHMESCPHLDPILTIALW